MINAAQDGRGTLVKNRTIGIEYCWVKKEAKTSKNFFIMFSMKLLNGQTGHKWNLLWCIMKKKKCYLLKHGQKGY
jgi:hypothetical protein